MLPTFIIGLREGLEAAFVVGIIAAFLVRQGRCEALRQVWAGVLLAVAVCLAAVLLLDGLGRALPGPAQEALETVVGVVAVALVTVMVLWLRRHARTLRGGLEQAATAALAAGSARALVAMAFLAVVREGFETSVFLLATFQASTERTPAVVGAVLGLAASVGLGYGLYRGGVRVNLRRFFAATALVLVVVAAGLLMTAAHTAHEAGWLDVGQATALDLRWLVRPGTAWSAFVTGALGVQPRPTVLEALLWCGYVLLMAVVLLWPQPLSRAARTAWTGRTRSPR